MKRFVLTGIVLVVVVAAVAYFATLATGAITCLGDGDTYAVDSQAAKFCYSDSGWSAAFFLAELVVPVVCMIAFTVLAAVRERFAFLWIGAAASTAIILGMAAIPPNLNTDCSKEQVARGDNCGY